MSEPVHKINVIPRSDTLFNFIGLTLSCETCDYEARVPGLSPIDIIIEAMHHYQATVHPDLYDFMHRAANHINTAILALGMDANLRKDASNSQE